MLNPGTRLLYTMTSGQAQSTCSDDLLILGPGHGVAIDEKA